MAIAAMIAWVLTASIGAYMLRTWVTRGGLRRQRATGAGVPPAVVFGHASAALTGLLVWLGFVDTGLDLLAWLGVTVMAGAIALGVCTVTLWTPYPVADPPSEGGRGGLGGTVSPQEQGGSGGDRSPREDTVWQRAGQALAEPGAVILVGERLAEVPGALAAAARLAVASGAKLAWIPRRAGERGAIEAGAMPGL